jgi:tripartite-type tricarboxylate transporter receptor subunit TctC
VVVENRAGASGTIGSVHVARSQPDGGTILFAPNTFAIAPHVLRRGANYDPVADFTPIIMTGTSPLLLVATPASGIRTVADVVAQARDGRLQNYGSPGSGSPMNILAEMFNRAAGIRLAEVAYRGTAPAITDLLAGVLRVAYTTPGAVTEQLRAGTLVPIAVSERGRSPILPEVPSLVEAGYEVEIGAWWGVFGPRGLPPALARTMGEQMDAVLGTPEVTERMRVMGVVTGGGGPERLEAMNRADFERFGRLVRELGIQAD